jgi:MoaD family protein
MRLRVRLFASFRQAVGSGQVEVELGPAASVGDLLAAVGERYPALRPLLDGTLVAVNLEYVGPEHPLQATDEAALIPPVSGGCQA